MPDWGDQKDIYFFYVYINIYINIYIDMYIYIHMYIYLYTSWSIPLNSTIYDGLK